MLTPEEVAVFKSLVWEVYGIKLTNSEAFDQGSRLIKLFELLLKNKIQLQNVTEETKNE